MQITLINGKGALFTNKEAGENGPAMRGNITFTESKEKDSKKVMELQIAAFAKTKGEMKYMSLSVGGMNGALFPNDKKDKETAPDYTGILGDKDGEHLRIAGWKEVSANSGVAYISLSASEPRSNGESAPAASSAGESGAPDFPF